MVVGYWLWSISLSAAGSLIGSMMIAGMNGTETTSPILMYFLFGLGVILPILLLLVIAGQFHRKHANNSNWKGAQTVAGVMLLIVVIRGLIQLSI